MLPCLLARERKRVGDVGQPYVPMYEERVGECTTFLRSVKVTSTMNILEHDNLHV